MISNVTLLCRKDAYFSPLHPVCRLDRTQDFKKVAKIVAPYTEIKEIYKNLKTNKNSNIFY